MKKPILVVPRTAVREVAPNADTDRLLASGSWCRVGTTAPESEHTRAQRAYRHHRMEEGCRRLDLWLPEQVFSALRTRQREGESMAVTIKRLLESPECTCDKR